MNTPLYYLQLLEKLLLLKAVKKAVYFITKRTFEILFYAFVLIIFFNTSLSKSAFSTYYFENPLVCLFVFSVFSVFSAF